MKIRFFVLLLFCVCVLTACHPGTLAEIFNNTGKDLTIVSFNTKLEPTRYSLKNGQSTQVGIPYKLQVQSSNGIWNYALEPISRDFEKKVHANIYLDKFQIEKNGEIYTIPPDSTGLVTNFPIQPLHYPIKPQ